MILAHIGHWYAEIMYVAPVVAMVGWLKLTSVREKRRERRTSQSVLTQKAEPQPRSGRKGG